MQCTHLSSVAVVTAFTCVVCSACNMKHLQAQHRQISVSAVHHAHKLMDTKVCIYLCIHIDRYIYIYAIYCPDCDVTNS